MKIAISSTGKNLEAEVDVRFGRCPYFLIVEIDKEKKIKKIETIKNTATAQFSGAGITSSQLVANKKVDVVITTNLGPRALQVLKQLNIEIYQGKGKINSVLSKFIKGELRKIGEPTGPMFMGEE